MRELGQELAALGDADINEALDELPVPAFVIDVAGVIRWQNGAAVKDGGKLVGRDFEDALPPEMLGAAKKIRRRVLEPGQASDFTIDLVGPDGRTQTREISVAPLRGGGSVLGMFGVATRVTERPASPATRAEAGLTPRQLEILQLLADGKSTAQIAEALYLSKTTVRNHVAHVLANLGVHTRVQAVVAGSRLGLVRMHEKRPPEE